MSEEEKTINKENEKPSGMSKKQTVIFWIIFPIVSLLITALMVFYLDLARGPLAITIIEFINIAVAIVLTIIFRNKRVYFRLIPLSAFFIITAILLPLANPIVVKKHATGNFNATPTEVLELQNGKVRGIYNNDETVEAIAFANRKNQTLNPTSSLAMEVLNAYEALAETTQNKKAIIDSVARISTDYHYVTPVRQKAYRLLKKLSQEAKKDKKDSSESSN